MIMAIIKKEATDLQLGSVALKGMVSAHVIQQRAGHSICTGCGLEDCFRLECRLCQDRRELAGQNTTY
ncbi:MAG: hypothetical protein H8E73_06105 [Planctomycetes bacterium]|nr:hypothetical protein [Planctomycetota bacterium]